MNDLRWMSSTSVLLIIIGNCASNENGCPVLGNARHISISNILGTWYAVRGIEHTNVQNTLRQGTNKDCNSMTINQNNESELILQWTKNNLVKFQINSKTPNIWESSDSTISAFPMRTLQVTDVDDKHIVITICTPTKRLSSAVLHREPTFNQEKVSIATNKLTEQNIKTVEIFDRCQSVT